MSDADPPSVDSWKPNLDFKSQTPEVRLACEKGWTIIDVHFASYGTPKGACGAFSIGSCHANVVSIVHQVDLPGLSSTRHYSCITLLSFLGHIKFLLNLSSLDLHTS